MTTPRRRRPSRSVVTSFQTSNNSNNPEKDYFDGTDWIVCLENNPDETLLAAATTPSCQVHLYDPNTLQLLHNMLPQQKSTNNNNNNRINNVLFADHSTLLAVHQEGTVWMRDVRETSTNTRMSWWTLPQPAPHLPPEPALCLSLGCDRTLLAVGSQSAKIHFYDVRNLNHASKSLLLGSYVDCHTDAVSQVHFDDTTGSTLVSGGEDGLLTVLDVRQPTEALAHTATINVGAPVRTLRPCGENGLCCVLTGSETVSLWNTRSALCVVPPESCSVVGDHARSSILQGTKGSGSNNVFGNPTTMTNTVDYFVDAQYCDNSDTLWLCSASHTGTALLQTISNISKHTMTTSSCWQSQQESCVLEGGHVGVIRASCCFRNNNNHKWFTAGEDARMVEWNLLQSGMDFSTTTTSGGGGRVVTKRQRVKHKAAPY